MAIQLNQIQCHCLAWLLSVRYILMALVVHVIVFLILCTTSISRNIKTPVRQSANADRCPLLKAATIGMVRWEVDQGATQEVSLVWRIKLYFYIMWMNRCIKMHYGIKSSWQRHCNALGNVLLVILRSCHSCWCYYTCHLPKHCCRPSIPLHGHSIP